MNMHSCLFASRSAAGTEATDAARIARQRRMLLWSALAVLLFVAFLAYKARAPSPSTSVAEPPLVTVIVPGTHPIVNAVHATGTIHARHDMPVGVVGEGGMISRIRVEAGQNVRKGQILADIDHAVQQAQLDQLKAGVAEAKANAALAREELRRAEALVERGFISRADIDRKTATRDAAIAHVAMAEGRLREMQERLDRLFIRAPEAGLVLARHVETGQIVSPASGALYRIAAGGEMEMRAEIAEQDMPGLSVGQTVTVTPAGSQNRYVGRIWLLEPIIDPQSREGIARIALPADAGAADLRAGVFATAIIEGQTQMRPLLPQSAVLADGHGSYVMALDKDDIIRRIPVTIGSMSSEGVAITSGLGGQERVLKSAGSFFSAGEQVTPRLQTRGSVD